MKAFGILIITAFLTGCLQEKYINHYQTTCKGYGPTHRCFTSKNNVSEEWTIFDGTIINYQSFNYEWGYVYKLGLVQVPMPFTAIADGPSAYYVFTGILEKNRQPSGTLFQIPVGQYESPDIVRNSDGTYTLYGKTQFDCFDSVCAELDSLLGSNMAMLLEFMHQDNPALPFTLNRVSCSGSTDFWSKCMQTVTTY